MKTRNFVKKELSGLIYTNHLEEDEIDELEGSHIKYSKLCVKKALKLINNKNLKTKIWNTVKKIWLNSLK